LRRRGGFSWPCGSSSETSPGKAANFSWEPPAAFTRIVEWMRGLRPIFAVVLLGASLVAVSVPAHAADDAVQFFHNIDVTPDTPVHDAVCFFCNVRVSGKVTGDIVVFFGNVHIDGEAQHDVVNFFGNVTATDNSSIDHDLVSMMGAIRLGENVSVGEDMVCLFGSVHGPSSVHVSGDRVGIPGVVLFIPFVVLFLIVFAIVQAFRAHQRRRYMAGYPLPPRF
jgi:hypothetical protein